MTADFLLIDVGNGRTKLGLATREAILDRRELPTREATPDLVRQTVAGWTFQSAFICSVVPAAVQAFRDALPNLTVLNHQTSMGIGIRYPKPESIGADRLANAVALAHLHGAPGIVIDFGTAVTFDILSADRHYIGGVIAPGLRLMTDYLHERTALLPQVELMEPETAIGQSTVGAIQAGAAIGYRGMIKGILEALKKELPPGPLHIVATGGDAGWIIAGMDEEISVDADLTLHGLRLVASLPIPPSDGLEPPFG
ncbi:type III pantothenate kinase [Prosthecobacter fusiformis]|uniref:Type III pantothenate kinase n=1 Tax=Prosthecobacter fusiformis TaxID=48464 RepID=A0A4R7RYI1_9BACT|nr:type III pantothenate kinase [Prosthecobacter fusiformis]TDU71004.1 type III pantothenate kinase [Prosthecobacter fusiformis]